MSIHNKYHRAFQDLSTLLYIYIETWDNFNCSYHFWTLQENYVYESYYKYKIIFLLIYKHFMYII